MKRLLSICFLVAALAAAFASSGGAAPSSGRWDTWALRSWNPRDTISGTPVLWLNANVDNVSVISNAVDVWNDKAAIAGSSNNPTANSSGKRPAWAASSAGVGATITFDGSTTGLEMNNVITAGAFTVATLFKLSATPGAGTAHCLLSLPMAATPTYLDILFWGSGGGNTPIAWSAKLPAGGQAAVGISPTLDTSTHRLIITYNNGTATSTGSYTAMYDGAAQTIQSSAVVGSGAIGAIGARVGGTHAVANVFQGVIKTVFIYSAVLSSAEQTRLDKWLAVQP